MDITDIADSKECSAIANQTRTEQQQEQRGHRGHRGRQEVLRRPESTEQQEDQRENRLLENRSTCLNDDLLDP